MCLVGVEWLGFIYHMMEKKKQNSFIPKNNISTTFCLVTLKATAADNGLVDAM